VYLNSRLSNIAILFVFGVCCALGLDSIWKALENPFPVLKNGRAVFFWINLLFTGAVLVWLSFQIFSKSANSETEVREG